VEDAKALAACVLADGEYSQLEKRTMRWIRENFEFSFEADHWYRHEIASWASRVGHLQKRIATPSSSSSSSSSSNSSSAIPATPVQQQPMDIYESGTIPIPPEAYALDPIIPQQYPQYQMPSSPAPSLYNPNQYTAFYTEEEELRLKAEIDKWFAGHEIEAVRKLLPEVKALDLKAVLSVTREDWQSMVGVLTGVGISVFLNKFRSVSPFSPTGSVPSTPGAPGQAFVPSTPIQSYPAQST